MPTFSAPLDCTPWVIGGLWPIELSDSSFGVEKLAEDLREDLQRIAESANDDLRAVARAGMGYLARRNAEARVIDEARALAVRRVDSTMRHVHGMRHQTPTRPPGSEAGRRPGPGNWHDDMEKAQVLPVVRPVTPRDAEETQVIPAVMDERWSPLPVGDRYEQTPHEAAGRPKSARDSGKHWFRPNQS